jgi:hypothetical protein
LVVNNKQYLFETIGIRHEDIICENPFFQKKTARYAGCQIDYMIQTKFETLYVCEVKFSKTPIGSAIIQELQTKIKTIHCPKRFSFRPVLIHVNGVTEDVVDADYFSNIIDFSELL